MTRVWIVLLLVAGIWFTSCKKKTSKFAKEPYVTLRYLQPDSIRSGSSEDTISLAFNFTDGDADIGNDPGSGNFDVYVKDSRDTSYNYQYYFPEIEEKFKDPDVGLEGATLMHIPAAFFTLRPDHPDRDTFHFSFYIKDRAGHQSNIVETPDMIIIP